MFLCVLLPLLLLTGLLIAVLISLEEQQGIIGFLICWSILTLLLSVIPGIVFALYHTQIYADCVRVRHSFVWKDYPYSQITGFEYGGEVYSDAIYLFSGNKCIQKIHYQETKNSAEGLHFFAQMLFSNNIPLVFRSSDGTVKVHPTDVVLRAPKGASIATISIAGIFSIAGIIAQIGWHIFTQPIEWFGIIMLCVATVYYTLLYIRFRVDIGTDAITLHRIFQKPLILPYNQITKVQAFYGGKWQNRASRIPSQMRIYVGNKQIFNVTQAQKGYVALAAQLLAKNVPVFW